MGSPSNSNSLMIRALAVQLVYCSSVYQCEGAIKARFYRPKSIPLLMYGSQSCVIAYKQCIWISPLWLPKNNFCQNIWLQVVVGWWCQGKLSSKLSILQWPKRVVASSSQTILFHWTGSIVLYPSRWTRINLSRSWTQKMKINTRIYKNNCPDSAE